ncbi:MAG: hypothetical protein ACRDT4_02420 [Micromonosporaceae bacterium]
MDNSNLLKRLARHALVPTLIAIPAVFLSGLLSGLFDLSPTGDVIVSAVTALIALTSVLGITFWRLRKEGDSTASDGADSSRT